MNDGSHKGRQLDFLRADCAAGGTLRRRLAQCAHICVFLKCRVIWMLGRLCGRLRNFQKRLPQRELFAIGITNWGRPCVPTYFCLAQLWSWNCSITASTAATTASTATRSNIKKVTRQFCWAVKIGTPNHKERRSFLWTTHWVDVLHFWCFHKQKLQTILSEIYTVVVADFDLHPTLCGRRTDTFNGVVGPNSTTRYDRRATAAKEIWWVVQKEY